MVVQSVQIWQSELVQHMSWQVPGSWWVTVQFWKHAMLDAHSLLLRQFSVSLQQLPTMHWLHGVPPGSSVQVPASMMGFPQFEPLHARPTQH